jgi:hypothetical protein
MATAPTHRRFIQPRADDTLATIAARELPDLPAEEALSALQSWNLHVLVRPLPGLAPGSVIGSDLIYVEPPPA